MAKATAICTCHICGDTFTKTTTKQNRRDADSWESWAVQNYDQCPKCWGAEQRKKEQESPLTLVVDCLPYNQKIILHFAGNTIQQKDTIKSLGYFWQELPAIGTLGLLSMSRPPLAWCKIIDLDQLESEFAKVESLAPIFKNNITDLDILAFQQIKAKNDDIESRKAAIPKPHVPTKLAGTKWNQKIYGKKGNYSIYPDGNKVELTDSEAKEIEVYLVEKEVYRKAIAEIK